MTRSRARFRIMTTHSVGIDMIELDRVRKVLRKYPDRFIHRVFTPAETAFCRGRVPELAARFSAKEAIMKALGTGARSVAWRDIEVLPDQRGKPLVYLYGGAAERAERIGLEAIDISLTHLESFAVASVVCTQRIREQEPEDARPRLIARLRQRGLLEGEGADERLPDKLPPIQK
jgi:holo-[acyl-carrier protein] synthase